MAEIYTTGRWKPSPGHEEAFIQAWLRFAAWASARDGAGELRLTRDSRSGGVFVSFGAWEGAEAVRSWKSAPDFQERLARVLQHADDFEPAELEVVATAESGAGSVTSPAADLRPAQPV